MESENSLWKGRPSQIENLFIFIALLAFAIFIVPIFIIFWKWLGTRMTSFELTNQRLIKKSGILNRQEDEIELYRVKDYRIERPFYLNIFGLGKVRLATSDVTNPVFIVGSTREPEKLRDMIRENVERRRSEKGVRELDI